MSARDHHNHNAEGGFDSTRVAQALAKAVYDGDIVNFRLVFQPFSPARVSSNESFFMKKYAYLLPDEQLQQNPEYKDLFERICRDDLDYVRDELRAKRPARMPAGLILSLADNALRAGKYTSAAQAYELLRIRSRMQEKLFDAADAELEAGHITAAVRGYIMATGVEYDYSAFPEPLPAVPDYQRRALMLHGEYPRRPEDSVPMYSLDSFLRVALSYLLLSPQTAARLDKYRQDVRMHFCCELVHMLDPKWNLFVERYNEAVQVCRDFESRIAHAVQRTQGGEAGLAEEIEEALGGDPMSIPAVLLGRRIPDGEWWQYLKEIAYLHPAAALFVSRQLIGDLETLVPRYNKDNHLMFQLIAYEDKTT